MIGKEYLYKVTCTSASIGGQMIVDSGSAHLRSTGVVVTRTWYRYCIFLLRLRLRLRLSPSFSLSLKPPTLFHRIQAGSKWPTYYLSRLRTEAQQGRRVVTQYWFTFLRQEGTGWCRILNSSNIDPATMFNHLFNHDFAPRISCRHIPRGISIPYLLSPISSLV